MRDRKQGIHFADSDSVRVNSYGDGFLISQLRKRGRSLVPMLDHFCNGVLDVVPESIASTLFS